MISRGRYVANPGTTKLERPNQAAGAIVAAVSPDTVTETPVQDVLSQLALIPLESYQVTETLPDERLGTICCIRLSTDPDPRPHTTACLAPHRVASATEFQVYSTRPNSSIPSSTAKKSAATRANSTAVVPR